MDASRDANPTGDLSVPPDALGRCWAAAGARGFHTRLVEVGDRMAGHPGERRAADLVADALADAGVREVTVESFDVPTWHRGDADLAVVEPVERSFEALALPYSPAGEVSAPLVDVGYGTPEEIEAADLDGAVAVARTDSPPDYGRFVHRMESYGHAVDAGAAAFVFANHLAGQLPVTGSLRFDGEAPIPGVGVSYETGEWLREYAGRGGVASLRVDARTEPGTSHNVHGVLGPTPSGTGAGEVLLLAHHDAHDVAEGAMDNGAGVAVVVVAARLLAATDLDGPVRVATVGSEEVGLHGSRALARRLDAGAVKAVVNVDGAGRRRTLEALTMGNDSFAEAAERLAAATDRPVEVDEHGHPFSDHWPFLREGVPAMQLHSASDDPGRGWGHTAADTRDKVDYRDVRSHAMLTALLVADLAGAEAVEPVDFDALATDLRGRDLDHGMRAAGIWPEAWD